MSFLLLIMMRLNNSKTPFVRIFPLLRIELVAGSDRRTENFPTSNEIAGIIPYDNSEVSFRDIRIYLCDNGRDRKLNYTNISQTHVLYMPLHYTLLFSNGDLGWHWGTKLTKDKGDRLSQRAYHRFRLHQRSN
jgi:hypothetical protein